MANLPNRSARPPQPAGQRVSLRGVIDMATAPTAFARVTAEDPGTGDVVTLDLNAVEFIDARGIAMLLKAQSYLDARGSQLILANPSDRVVRVLRRLGLIEQFAFE